MSKINWGIAVLAGGGGKRMGGVSKADLPLGSGTFMDGICTEIRKLCRPSYLSVARYEVDCPESWKIVPDRIYGPDGDFIGPIGGLLSLLKEAAEDGLDGLFTVPCDMPLFRKEVAALMMAGAEDKQADAYLWRTRDGRLHPVCGYYSVAAIPVIERQIAKGNYRLRSLSDLLNAVVWETSAVHIPDRWFLNINDAAGSGYLQNAASSPPVLAVCGMKKTGKTMLLTRIISMLTACGVRCAAIKHDGHDFTADVPETDSYRLKTAGAVATVVYSGTKFCIVGDKSSASCEDFFFCCSGADIIFLEGHKSSPYPKIEMLKREISESPAADPETIIACVSDDPEILADHSFKLPVYASDDMDKLLELIIEQIDSWR